MSSLPKILDGKFYCNIQPNRKTIGGIQATCTTCLGIISGTTKSTGNFLSHIKRRHKDLLPSCQQHCQSKSMSHQMCRVQGDAEYKIKLPFPYVDSAIAKLPNYSIMHNFSKKPKDMKNPLGDDSSVMNPNGLFISKTTLQNASL